MLKTSIPFRPVPFFDQKKPHVQKQLQHFTVRNQKLTNPFGFFHINLFKMLEDAYYEYVR